MKQVHKGYSRIQVILIIDLVTCMYLVYLQDKIKISPRQGIVNIKIIALERVQLP